MSSTKISAPRTLVTFPSARIVAIAVARSDQLAAHDREPLIGGSHHEPGSLPERRCRGARRIERNPDLGIRLDRGEAPTGQVVARGGNEAQRVALAPGGGGRRDAGD